MMKFSKWARGYVLVYKAFDFSGCQMNTKSPCIISHERIENIMTSFKTYRSAMDFDKNIYTEMFLHFRLST
jgi:hypothetical protein